MSEKAVQALRKRLAANKYQQVAVFNWDAPHLAERDRGKVPIGKAWQKANGVPRFDARAVNTGILTGIVYPADIDVDDSEAAASLRALAVQILGPVPTYRSRPNSPRVLLPYRVETPCAKRIIRLSCGKIEFLGTGQQFVAYGHHFTGVPLKWCNGGLTKVPLHKLTVITQAQIDTFVREAAKLYPPAKKPTNGDARQHSSKAGSHSDTPADAELIDIIRTGAEGLHDAILVLAARMISGERNNGFVVNFIRRLMEETPEADRDRRWQDRYDDVPRAVATAEAKWGKAQDDPDDEEDEDFGTDAKSGAPRDPFSETEALPLCPEPRTLEPYPIEALGPLQAVTEGIAESVGCEPSLAAQSVLMAACLAVVGIANIDLPRIGNTPLALYLVTVARSSERKSSADKRALLGVKARVAELIDEHKARATKHANDVKAYAAEVGFILRDRKIDRATRKAKLDALGPEPKPLLKAVLAAHDVTVEGVMKAWSKEELWPIQALTTSEGGMFVSGAAMNQEMRLRTVATLCALWDGEALTKLRAGDGVMTIGNKRLTAHLMIQPNFIPELLGDAVLRQQGFLSRLLVSWPRSRIGYRVGSVGSAEAKAAEKAFNDRIHELLFRHMKESLDLGTLRVEGKAADLWGAYSDEIEVAQRPGAEYAELTDVAGKSAEMAGRIAGVLTLYAKPSAETVPAETMRNGIALARWYLNEALRIAETGALQPEIVDAQELLDWFRANPGERSRRAVLHNGPHRLRSKRALDPVLRILVEHQLIVLPKRGPIQIRD